MTVKIKFRPKDRKGQKITGNIGQTRANRAAYQLWRGNVEFPQGGTSCAA